MSSRRKPERPVAAVGVVVWRGESFMLVRRGSSPRRGQWSIPGGAQQVGETVYAAARREVLEETGLQVELRGLVDVVDCITRDQAGSVDYHYTLVDLFAESPAGEPRARDDAAAVAWFTLADLPRLALWSETERVIRKSGLLRSRSSAELHGSGARG